MKIIANDLPKYTVVFNHPDDSSRVYEVCVDLENESTPWTDAEWERYHKRLLRDIWEKFNHYGYWHTMTITADYCVDGKVYTANICEEASWVDIDFDVPDEEYLEG